MLNGPCHCFAALLRLAMFQRSRILGYCFDTGTGVKADPAKAVLWYTRAAEAGHPEALMGLADMYRAGRGVRADAAQGLALVRKAADGGCVDAQYKLGIWISNGYGIAPDPAQGFSWYLRQPREGLPRPSTRPESASRWHRHPR